MSLPFDCLKAGAELGIERLVMNKSLLFVISHGIGVAVSGCRYDSMSLVFLEFFINTLTSISLLNETRLLIVDVIGLSIGSVVTTSVLIFLFVFKCLVLLSE